MELALYTPDLGFYCNNIEKFGPNGHFITAPLVSPLFSQCLAKQCHQILDILPNSDILEMGAGTGQMAIDILLALETLHKLPKHYFILELSETLRKKQQENIQSACPHLYSRVHWVNTLPPENSFRGIILANELLDAMPVHLFKILDNTLLEFFVVEKNEMFEFEYIPTQNLDLITFYRSQNWPSEYISEFNTHLKPLIKNLSSMLKSGIILFIDYGFPRKEYYHPDRNMGTLMCHYQHTAHQNPLLYPGLQDITAHVDFTAIAEIGSEENLEVAGYTNQASFLIGCGLLDLIQQNSCKTDKERLLQNNAVQKLTSPTEMGELFKAIALSRNINEPLVGFQFLDKSYML